MKCRHCGSELKLPLVGFALAWLAVLLCMRHPGVSPWLVLLACAYPVTEVLYSVWRRRAQNRSAEYVKAHP